MSKQCPCLIFSSDGYLFDEVDVLSSIREIHDIDALRLAFDTALGDDLQAFRDFCFAPMSQQCRYRIFRLRGLPSMEYAFCEKNSLLDHEYTNAFLSDDISDFYRFMTPEASFPADTASRVIYELLSLRSKRQPEPVNMTPEAFLVFDRIPNLTEAIFRGSHNHYCDICAVTERIIACFTENPLYENVKIMLRVLDPVTSRSPDNSFVNLPLKAFVALMILNLSVAVALSKDRTASITLTKMRDSADISVSVPTDKLEKECLCRSIDGLSDADIAVDSLVRIASVISMMFDIGLSFSYTQASGELSIHTVIGGEIAPAADFKFSEPTEEITKISEETLAFLNTIN